MLSAISSRRRFADLSEQEILALAISSEEDDASIYRTYAERLRAEYPATAAVFDGMAAEEDDHRRSHHLQPKMGTPHHRASKAPSLRTPHR